MMIPQIGKKSSNIFVDRNFKVRCFFPFLLFLLRKNEPTHFLTFVDYFTKVLEDNLKAVVKPQYVDQIPKAVKGPEKSVDFLLKARAQMDNLDKILDVLGE